MTTPNENTTLAIASPVAIQSLEEMDGVAKKLAASGLMGKNTTPEMVFGLMLLCQCEGLNPIAAMKRYHIVEGRPSMRADAMQAEFLAHGGAIIFHVRTDGMVAATLFSDKGKLDDAARKRANDRFAAMWDLDCCDDDSERSELMVKVSSFSMEGEETIIRTFADCQAKGITEGREGTKANWKSSPRQMLTARVITEGVRLVNPGLIAGIYNEDETADIVRQEKEALAKMLEKPTEADVESIMGIIATYDDELKTDLPDSRRKMLLGLRSDLVLKLGDLGLKMTTAPEAPQPTVGGIPATTVETVVLPHEKTEATTKQPATRRQRPAAPVAAPSDDIDTTPRAESIRPEQNLDTPWREFVCLRGNIPGPLNGQTLGHIFTEGRFAPKNPDMVEKLISGFVSMKIPTSLDEHDKILWSKVQEAAAELTAKFADTPATPAGNTMATPATEKPAQQTASATRWQDFIVVSRSPDWNGKKLGSMSSEDVKRLKVEYLDKLDMSRATLVQKSLVANVTMAMADLFPTKAEPDLPEKANKEPFDHTQMLKDLIAANKWDAGFFITQCKLNTWIDESVRKIDDITAEEFESLDSGWATVEDEMKKAHQPAQQP